MESSSASALRLEQFDVIIVGTGLVESLLSAALASHGAQVLHVGASDRYGDRDASVRAEQLMQVALAETQSASFASDKRATLRLFSETDCKEGWPRVDAQASEFSGNVGLLPYTFHHVHANVKAEGTFRDSEWPDAVSEQQSMARAPTEIQSNAPRKDDWHDIELDMRPRAVMCSEPLMDLVATTSVRHYVEISAMHAVYLCPQKAEKETAEVKKASQSSSPPALIRVPCSRADVFQSDSLTLRDKRVLMRMLAESDSETEGTTPGAEQPSFLQWLDQHDVPAHVQYVVCSGIAGIDDDDVFCDSNLSKDAGMARVRAFMSSLRRFRGTCTPFVTSVHGASDLAQAFCRLSAIYGTVFRLRTPLVGLLTRDDGAFSTQGQGPRCCGIITADGTAIRARRHVFVSGDLYRVITSQGDEEDTRRAGLASPQLTMCRWRYIGLCTRSVSHQHEQCIIMLPAGGAAGNMALVRVLQLVPSRTRRHSISNGPKVFSIHVESSSHSDLELALTYLGVKDTEEILMSVLYSQRGLDRAGCTQWVRRTSAEHKLETEQAPPSAHRPAAKDDSDQVSRAERDPRSRPFGMSMIPTVVSNARDSSDELDIVQQLLHEVFPAARELIRADRLHMLNTSSE
ncbi:Rab proteins geranylgeranyltransferase component A [Porphyridium purpureum]|uniref:Rab proteins geranylgeranyltransferase component A n=1 Tax=Porphyridium purpureum TaxID=35688 RepID=A0A5J4Z0S8_PORPP|nr:Rab proteins geranylgeranyltransferase component A [Porphyridium purpureum]|eukprot:POR8088..scf295_1